VGPWCFVDLILPPDFDDPHPLEVGPHPHIGLSTVTWILEGEALHTDSLGSEQPIRPGQLNLMSAGNGIAHAELGTTEGIHGVQMWLAQPEGTRHGSSRFEHIPDLPVVDFPAAQVKVMIGELDGYRSLAEVDWATVGLDVTLHGHRTEIPAEAGFEYAVIPIDHKLKVEDAIVEPGWLALVPAGAETLPIEGAGSETRFLVLGGEPLGEPIEMWWNFVARTKEEITRAWRAWQEHDLDRFGNVSSDLSRIDAPPPPWLPAG
jgi:redox-sensitive bicupin YhaK (pirin superfamily)